METSGTTIAGILRCAIRAGLLDDGAPAALFYDLRAFHSRLSALSHALPHALHAVAVKACPLPSLLRLALDGGFGLEVASEGELALARHLGAPPDRIVFDSPAKTRAEIALALSHGARLNIDNLQELDRVAEAMASDPSLRPASVGLRVNPEVQGARIAGSFTAGRGSKFGVPMEAHRQAILDAFATYPWLDALHVHIGSQGVPLSLLIEGLGRVVDLARELSDRGKRLRAFDIGGGLPVRYRPEDAAPDFAEYAARLRHDLPGLFSGPWQLITEFGRATFASCGFAASRVEYTRPEGIAVIHLGADLFVRTALVPQDWFHEVEVFDAQGCPKTGPLRPWSIAGPLCFSGDFVARGRLLPPIDPGDVIAIRDAGAYTLSMWSRYNSRLAPAVYGYDGEGMKLLKARETTADILHFWGAEPRRE